MNERMNVLDSYLMPLMNNKRMNNVNWRILASFYKGDVVSTFIGRLQRQNCNGTLMYQ